MTKHLEREIEKLKKRILFLGSLVEERVQVAIESVTTRNRELAKEVIMKDYEIDELEVEVEEDCLKVLALHQPVAVDLRFLIAVIKINNDLERIGDEAVNISQRVESITKSEAMTFPFDFSVMGAKAVTMLRTSLDALVNLDLDLAFKVLTMDDEVDELNRKAYDKAKEIIRASPELVRPLINYYLISRHLERIGDHATNLAEEVIYLVEGEIVRHGKWE